MNDNKKLSAREQWLVKRIQGNTILDVGFAGQKGQLPPYYSLLTHHSRNKRTIIGVDLNAQAVFALKQPRSIIGNAGRLPVVDESIDCVVMAEFIEHHMEIRPFLTESWRVLRRGGTFLITTPNPGFFNRWLFTWLSRTSEQMSSTHNLQRAMGHDDHQILWDPLSLCNVLCRLGFSVKEMTTLGNWVPFIGYVIPRFRRGLYVNVWPFNRVGYITCVCCMKK